MDPIIHNLAYLANELRSVKTGETAISPTVSNITYVQPTTSVALTGTSGNVTVGTNSYIKINASGLGAAYSLTLGNGEDLVEGRVVRLVLVSVAGTPRVITLSTTSGASNSLPFVAINGTATTILNSGAMVECVLINYGTVESPSLKWTIFKYEIVSS